MVFKKLTEIPRAGSLTLILCIPIYKLWFFKKKFLACAFVYLYIFGIYLESSGSSCAQSPYAKKESYDDLRSFKSSTIF